MTDIVVQGGDLTREQTAQVFTEIMSGRLTDGQIERFLAAMADKGESVEEIVGAAEVMRRHVTPVACDDPSAVDTCGTGGDGISTFNVSTAAAVVAAGAGARVAKHGNRTNTRKSGSAEVLQALGVNIDAPPQVVARCIREARIGFLYAAKLHPAMAHAAAARRKLARRTLFNILGPLTNPAGVRRQVIGVASDELIEEIARALQRLGAVHAFVVHGHDGLCDLTVTGPSSYAELRDGQLLRRTITPEELGLKTGPLDALRVDSPAESAAAIRAILAGEAGPRRDHTLLNAAATLAAAGVASDLHDGVRRAAAAIDAGAAAAALDRLITITGAPE
ncbi:MAG: anthranilate phosphoribosyltransferase [Phycisphaerae bacterium]|nr:anthranilate phosphoribosyltransferase [Phycisphaerae bacterium]